VRLGKQAQVWPGPDRVLLGTECGAPESFDVAIVAIGLTARDQLAAAAGLATADGVLTDCAGATTDPDVFAIGDVSRISPSSNDVGVRLESWRHAETQARLAAAAILGQTASYDEPAWFWSEQFDRLIQIAGLPNTGHQLIDATPDENPLWRFGRDGAVHTVIGVNRAREVRLAQRTLPSLAVQLG
jgi:3-phenylpropionate/trans-cinnamate dioxygenase ferredoxin reductase subunit